MFKMKFLPLVFFVLYSNLSAQNIELKGKKEYSVSFSYQSMKQEGANEASWIMNLPVHFNYFVSENIGIGAEINFTDAKGTDNTGIIVNALIEANFPLKSGKSIPFILAGYGYSNGSFLYDRMAFKSYRDTDIGVFNLGAGIKLHLTDTIYARVEGRYQTFTGDYKDDFYYGIYSNEIDITYFRMMMGFSIIL